MAKNQTAQTFTLGMLRRVAFVDTYVLRNDVYGNPRGVHLLRDRTGATLGVIERNYGWQSPSDVVSIIARAVGREPRGGKMIETVPSEVRFFLREIDPEQSGIERAHRITDVGDRYQLSYASGSRKWVRSA